MFCCESAIKVSKCSKNKNVIFCQPSCMGWYCLHKILNSLSRINFNWFNRIHLKMILLILFLKSLFFKTNLNCSCILLVDIFSIITQFFSREKKYLAVKGHWSKATVSSPMTCLICFNIWQLFLNLSFIRICRMWKKRLWYFQSDIPYVIYEKTS